MSTADDLDSAFRGLQFRISNARKQHWLASDNHQPAARVALMSLAARIQGSSSWSSAPGVMLAVGWMGGGGALWREMWAARAAHTGEQIGKKELLTTLLTDCLLTSG